MLASNHCSFNTGISGIEESGLLPNHQIWMCIIFTNNLFKSLLWFKFQNAYNIPGLLFSAGHREDEWDSATALRASQTSGLKER